MGYRFRRVINTSIILRLFVSIGLAFVVWGFVQWETDPERGRTIFGVQIEQENLDSSLQRTNLLPVVNVSLHGPESVIQDIDTSDVEAIIDLTDISTPGTSEQKIIIPAIDGIRAIEAEPSSVEVTVERIVTEEFEITLEQPLPTPPNISNIELSTDTVVLTGTQSQMDLVEMVVVNLDLSGRTDTFGADVSAVPVDSGGVEVEGLTVTPDVIHINILFEVQSRVVPVTVVCRCVTENGVELTRPDFASAIPSEIRVVGPASLVSEIESIETEPIDVSAIQESGWLFGVSLDESNLPAGVVVEVPSIDVWVEVVPDEAEFDNIPIAVVNVSPGLRAVLSDETASFTVSGTSEVLETLLEAPTPIVDATGMSPGTSRAPVQILLPSELSYTDLTPVEVQLTIIEVRPAETLSTEVSTDHGRESINDRFLS